MPLHADPVACFGLFDRLPHLRDLQALLPVTPISCGEDSRSQIPWLEPIRSTRRVAKRLRLLASAGSRNFIWALGVQDKVRTALQFLLLALLCGAFCFFLAWAKYEGPVYISGTVVNVVTGRPVPHEEIYLAEMNGGSKVGSTDATGHFTYYGKPYTCCFFSAGGSAPLLQTRFQGGIFGRRLEIHTGIIVPFIPPTQVSGHIYDQHSRPLAACRVDAMTYGPNEPFRQRESILLDAATQKTDQSGAYNFTTLGADRYSFIAHCEEPLTAAPVLYPQAIALRPGAHVNNIDFHLTPVAPITVHGRVTLSNGSAPVRWPTAIYSHDLQAHFSDPAFGALRLSSACNWRTPDVEFRCRLVSGNSYRLHFQVDNVIWGEAPSVPAQEADVAVQSQQTLNIRLTQRPPDPPSPNQTPSAGLPTGKVLIHGACPSGHSSEWMIIRSEPAYYIEQNMGLSNCSHPTEWILPAGNYRFVASFPYVQHQARKLDDFLFSQATPVTVKQGQTTEIGLKVSTPEEIARLALQSLVAHR